MLLRTPAIYFRFVLPALTLHPKLDKVPHECVSTADVITCQRAYHRCSWLFPQIDAALHHGGAGTTGASLRGEKIPRAWQRRFIYRVGVSWYSNAYPSLVWVSHGKRLVILHADLIPSQRPVLLGVQGAKVRRAYYESLTSSRGLMCDPQAGIKLNSLHSKEVSHALKKATTDR